MRYEACESVFWWREMAFEATESDEARGAEGRPNQEIPEPNGKPARHFRGTLPPPLPHYALFASELEAGLQPSGTHCSLGSYPRASNKGGTLICDVLFHRSARAQSGVLLWVIVTRDPRLGQIFAVCAGGELVMLLPCLVSSRDPSELSEKSVAGNT